MPRLNPWFTAAAAMLALSTAMAAAQGRPDVRQLTCGQARALVQRSGAIVLTTGRYTYDRFVASERFCRAAEMTRDAWVATRDAQSCRIGYTCVPDTRWEDRWWWLHRRH